MEIKQEILNTLMEFNKFIKKLKKSAKELGVELSRLDCKRNDLLHYIEGIFEDVKIHPMKVYKELKSVSMERRDIKNQLEIIHDVLSNNALGNYKTIAKTIEKINGLPKKYHMRYYSKDFKELFDDKEDNNV